MYAHISLRETIGTAGAKPVSLTARQQEYLLHALDGALHVRDDFQFLLWSQGQLQALLPHRVLLCLQFSVDGALQHSECLHGAQFPAGLRRRLSDPRDGLALALARECRARGQLPALLDGAQPAREAWLMPYLEQLRTLGLDNALVHGSEALPGGASCYVLFGMAQPPCAQQAYLLELLLPYLHLRLQMLGAQAAARRHGPVRPVSAREAEVLHWVREGKSNEEIGLILGISGLTVKNHLQRLYKLLGVSNRAHAIGRCQSLRLLDSPAQGASH
ncbi:helix-turn-helix transcriptional regulator [Oxalobacteraceae bacterium]|nr:helix-turn-helix transcriptional regulator [Oxalobacteraceae bacterium]